MKSITSDEDCVLLFFLDPLFPEREKCNTSIKSGDASGTQLSHDAPDFTTLLSKITHRMI
jgi:hypothetical protein